ncbi:MAG TPA: flagellar motor protein [Methylococcaceae bacterium]|nr:flagellar motor protein [Methylococcaceae bacterium]
MKRMDYLTLGGLFLGLLAIIGGNWMEGGHIDSLANGPAIVIVFGGTLGAVLLQTPWHTFRHAIGLLRWLVIPPSLDLPELIQKIVDWSSQARRDGLLGLEQHIDDEPDLFLRKGLQLLVDGNEPAVVRANLDVEVAIGEQGDLHASQVYAAMGGYSPTIGIIGAVMGLIHVMQNLSDPSKLGAGIATAFVATIYGVGMANLLFLPIAGKLRAHVQARTRRRELIIEGLLAIAEGENPKNIESKLQGFIQEG